MKIIMMIAVVMLTSSVVGAWEKKRNPDRFTSMGINLTSQASTGLWESTLNDAFNNQSVNTTSSLFVVDLRVPVTNWLTLNSAIGIVSHSIAAEETPYLAGQNLNQDGGMFSIGARFYFNRLITDAYGVR